MEGCLVKSLGNGIDVTAILRENLHGSDTSMDCRERNRRPSIRQSCIDIGSGFEKNLSKA